MPLYKYFCPECGLIASSATDITGQSLQCLGCKTVYAAQPANRAMATRSAVSTQPSPDPQPPRESPSPHPPPIISKTPSKSAGPPPVPCGGPAAHRRNSQSAAAAATPPKPAMSSFTPGPIVELSVAFLIYVPFTPDEILALAFGEDLLRALEGTVFHESIRSALQKIRAGLSPELSDYLARLGQSFRVLPGPHKSYARFRDTIRLLNDAVLRCEALNLEDLFLELTQ